MATKNLAPNTLMLGGAKFQLLHYYFNVETSI